jgi:uncharacterized membrane protein
VGCFLGVLFGSWVLASLGLFVLFSCFDSFFVYSRCTYVLIFTIFYKSLLLIKKKKKKKKKHNSRNIQNAKR